MYIKQISVFMENKDGKLGAITKILKEKRIDIRAFSISDTDNFGILRLIVREPEQAARLLRSAGMTAQLNDVVVIDIKDRTGSLDEIIQPLSDRHININYMYSFMGEKEQSGRLVLMTNNMKATFDALLESGFNLPSQEEI